MSCCDKMNLINFSGKVSDLFEVDMEGIKMDDRFGVPSSIGLGSGGDYVEFSYCSNCGKMVGEFPLKITKDLFKGA